MSAWETIGLAVVSGAAGTVIGALLNNSHQRAAELRSMRITAAADLVRRADRVRRVIREPHPSASGDGFEAVRDAWDDLAETVEIVGLLFGARSEAVVAAKVTANNFRDAWDDLRAVVTTGGGELESLEMHLYDAGYAMERFAAVSRTEIWDSPLKAKVRRLRVLLGQMGRLRSRVRRPQTADHA